jgi:tetratricopeptide (TPR) repeat protein
MASWLVWTEWLPGGLQIVGIGIAVVAWIGSAAAALQHGVLEAGGIAESPAAAEHACPPASNVDNWANAGSARPAEADTLFRRAQAQYLQGNWVAAGNTLEQLLETNRRDADARLLLATLCRHMERHEEADEHLSALERLESAQRWTHEIGIERYRLAEAMSGRSPQVPAVFHGASVDENDPAAVSIPHHGDEQRLMETCQGLDAVPNRVDPPIGTHTIGRTDAA